MINIPLCISKPYLHKASRSNLIKQHLPPLLGKNVRESYYQNAKQNRTFKGNIRHPATYGERSCAPSDKFVMRMKFMVKFITHICGSRSLGEKGNIQALHALI